MRTLVIWDQVYWCTHAILASERLKQWEFKSGLGKILPPKKPPKTNQLTNQPKYQKHKTIPTPKNSVSKTSKQANKKQKQNNNKTKQKEKVTQHSEVKSKWLFAHGLLTAQDGLVLKLHTPDLHIHLSPESVSFTVYGKSCKETTNHFLKILQIKKCRWHEFRF